MMVMMIMMMMMADAKTRRRGDVALKPSNGQLFPPQNKQGNDKSLLQPT